MNSRDAVAIEAACAVCGPWFAPALPNLSELNLLILAAESSAAAAELVMQAHAELAEAGEPEAIRRYSEAGELAIAHLRRRRMWMEARRLQVAADVARSPSPSSSPTAA
jgi:hypothetical protein